MDIRNVAQKVKQLLSSNKILTGTLVGVASGFCLGFILKPYRNNDAVRSLAGYPGELFIRALQLLILPLVIFRLMAGLSSINIKTNGKLALRTFGYSVTTSMGNAMFGALLAVIIHPGDSSIKSDLQSQSILTFRTSAEDKKNTLVDNFLDLGRNTVPNNLFTNFFETTVTKYTYNEDINEYVRSIGTRRGVNVFGIIFFFMVFGSVLSMLGEKVKSLLDIVKVVDLVNTKTISGLLRLTPFGVASLICAKVLEVDDMGKVISSLLFFIMTVLSGLMMYQFVILQLMYFLLVRKNPFTFYKGMLPAVLTAFAISSSSATLPVTLKCLKKFGIDERVSNFVAPIGVVCNMDGSVLFQVVSVVFLAQLNNIPLAIEDYVIICVLATALSLSASGGSLLLTPMILSSIGCPSEDIGLLFMIDWFCDRARTTNNTVGDCYASAIVEHWSKAELKGKVIDEIGNEKDKDTPPEVENSVV